MNITGTVSSYQVDSYDSEYKPVARSSEYDTVRPSSIKSMQFLD
jgi:hypothetical protein